MEATGIEETTGWDRKQSLLLATGGLGIVVAAFVIAAFAAGRIASGAGLDRIAFHYADATSEQLPPNADLAAAQGWSGSIFCKLGKGRFYQKAGSDGPYPVMPMYGIGDELVGIQIHSRAEQPAPPWEHAPEGLQTSVVENMEFEHWRLGLYLVKPVTSCGIKADYIGP